MLSGNRFCLHYILQLLLNELEVVQVVADRIENELQKFLEFLFNTTIVVLQQTLHFSSPLDHVFDEVVEHLLR